MSDDARAVLIGEAPSEGGDKFWRFPLSGPPARALCSMAGLAPVEDASTYGRWTWALYDRFECENLFRRYGDAAPWSVPVARERAVRMLPDLDGRVVVCLGRRVQFAVVQALAMPRPPEFHVWQSALAVGAPAALVAMPHPSGRNRVLNDPAERERCGATLRQALELAS